MRLILLCLLLLGLPATAEVYTYIDAEGNRVFTDSPGANKAQRIELAPTNSQDQPAPGIRLPPAYDAPVLPPAYQLLRILTPEPDTTLRDESANNLIVTATSEPSLLPGHSYRLMLNSQPASEPGRSPVFPLENLERGTHQLAVEILDTEGRILERTPNQPVHVQRISLAQKRQIHPCKRADYGVRPECPIEDKPPEKPSLLRRLVPGI